MATINMSKNQKVNMVKDDGSAIKKFFIGVNWDQNRYAGEADIDFDIHGFVTGTDRKVAYPQDIINYNTYDRNVYPGLNSPETILQEMIPVVLHLMESITMNILLLMRTDFQVKELISLFA